MQFSSHQTKKWSKYWLTICVYTHPHIFIYVQYFFAGVHYGGNCGGTSRHWSIDNKVEIDYQVDNSYVCMYINCILTYRQEFPTRSLQNLDKTSAWLVNYRKCCLTRLVQSRQIWWCIEITYIHINICLTRVSSEIPSGEILLHGGETSPVMSRNKLLLSRNGEV